MKTLLSTLFLVGSLAIGGCGDKEIKERAEYTIKDTIMGSTYTAIKNKDIYLLTVKGNLDKKYSKIIFADMNNDNSINMEDYITFYRGDSIDTHLGYNGVIKGLWKTGLNEFYNASDSSKLSQEIIKEARNQMENYFNPLYKKLRARADSLYQEKNNLKIKEKVNNFFNKK